MKRGRLIYAGAVGAALSVLLAPRIGESRRAALRRLRLALRSGRGSVGAFAGTPCSLAAANEPASSSAAPASLQGQGLAGAR